MDNIFDISKYGANTVMYCADYDSSLRFREYLAESGRTWISGHSYMTLDAYHTHPPGTGICYRFARGTHASLDYCIKRGYHILYFDEFHWGNFSDQYVTSETISEFLSEFNIKNI